VDRSVLVGLQRRLIYFPFPAQAPRAEAVVAGAREVTLRTADGGAVGEGDARDFTALGDTVNTAARLTDLAGAGEILISAEAASAGGLETTGLERRTLEIRGRDQSVDAWVSTAPRRQR
jgi:class 3 adenylate cyclase